MPSKDRLELWGLCTVDISSVIWLSMVVKELADLAIILPGKAMLKVKARPSSGLYMAVGFEVSISSLAARSRSRFRF